MRLSGPLPATDDPQAWADAHQRAGYSAAAWAPCGPDDPRLPDFLEAARKADLIIAEVGAWSNPISPNEKERKEAAIASTTGIRTLEAVAAAVPVRLIKRDLLFVVERLASLLDENRLAVVARQHGIKKAKDSESTGKLFAAYLRRAEESVLGRLVVELTIVLSAARTNAPQVLRDAASVYNVNTDAIALKVKQEFAAKVKAKTDGKAKPKAATKVLKKTA